MEEYENHLNENNEEKTESSERAKNINGTEEKNENENEIRLSNLKQSSIKNNITNNFPISKIESEIRKNNEKSYHCKYCKLFPLITILDDNNLVLNCKDEENSKKSFDIMLKYRLTSGKLEDLQKEMGCQKKEHNQKQFQYYCSKCKKNLCKDCCEEDEHSNENNSIIIFNELNNNDEFKRKEKYIKEYFEKEFENKDIKKYQNKLQEPEEIRKEIIDENNNVILSKIENSLNKNLDKFTNLKELSDIIFFCKNNLPNYRHYLNIENFYFYLLDKLNIKYYSYKSQAKQKINIFGKEFVEKNKENCYLIVKDNKESLRKDYDMEEDKTLEITLVKEKPIKDMSEMFYKCDFLSEITVKNQWIIDEVTDMNSMFYGCIALEKLDSNFFLNWDTSKVIDFSYMFYKCECLTELKNISKLNTKNANNISNMFYECRSLEKIDNISKWETNKVTDMSYMFYNCSSLEEIPGISNWDISNVTNLSNMFFGCEILKKLELNWKTNKVKNMSYMFADCQNLEIIGLLSWNTESVKYMNNMFQNCLKIADLAFLKNWDVGKVAYLDEMFNGIDEKVKRPKWYDKIINGD